MLRNGYQVNDGGYSVSNLRFILGTQATADSYKQWKIRADSTMLTADSREEQSSSSNDSSYFHRFE